MATTPQIGSEELTMLNGSFDVQGVIMKDETPPNIDGVKLRKLGKRAAIRTFKSYRDLDDADDAKTKMDTYKAMQGTLQTVILHDGRTYNNVAVHSVTEVAAETSVIDGAVGGLSENAEYLLTCTWQLQLTETS